MIFPRSLLDCHQLSSTAADLEPATRWGISLACLSVCGRQTQNEPGPRARSIERRLYQETTNSQRTVSQISTPVSSLLMFPQTRLSQNNCLFIHRGPRGSCWATDWYGWKHVLYAPSAPVCFSSTPWLLLITFSPSPQNALSCSGFHLSIFILFLSSSYLIRSLRNKFLKWQSTRSSSFFILWHRWWQDVIALVVLRHTSQRLLHNRSGQYCDVFFFFFFLFLLVKFEIL